MYAIAWRRGLPREGALFTFRRVSGPFKTAKKHMIWGLGKGWALQNDRIDRDTIWEADSHTWAGPMSYMIQGWPKSGATVNCLNG